MPPEPPGVVLQAPQREFTHSMLSSSRTSASNNSSSSKYNSKLKSISDFFLDKLPSWRRKSASNIEPICSENQEYVLTETQRKTLKEVKESKSYSNAPRNNSSSGSSNIPPLLPSLSESKIPSKSGRKSSSQQARAPRKIQVTNTAGRTSLESGNVVRIGSNKQSSPTKSPSRPSYSDYQGTQYTEANSSSSRKSLSNQNQDYSSSSVGTATDNSLNESPQVNPGNHNGRHTTSSSSPNVVIFGNNAKDSNRLAGDTSKSTAARTGISILSSLGFPSIGGGSKSHSNNIATATPTPTPTASTYHSNVNVITVKPAGYSNHTITATSTSSAYAGTPSPSTSSSSNTSSSHSFNSQYAHTIYKNSSTRDKQVNASTTDTYSYGSDSKVGSAGSNVASNVITAAPAGNIKQGAVAAATTSAVSGATAVASTKVATKVLCCDKCDGKHETDNCPYYKKKRDDHPDAQKNKQIGGVSSLPGNTLYSARVVRQPGDGSCLFHSMSYGLPSKSNAARLRAEICQFIQNNPNLKISDTPLQDWVKWDANSSVAEYARKMSRGSWGGGIEMACVSQVCALCMFTGIFLWNCSYPPKILFSFHIVFALDQ